MASGEVDTVGSGVASDGAAVGTGLALGTAIGTAAGLAADPAAATRGFTRGAATGVRCTGAATVGRVTGVLVGAGRAITGGAADRVAIGDGAAPLSSAGPAARGGVWVGTGKRNVDGFSLCSADCAQAPFADIDASANTALPAALRIIPNPTLFTLLLTEILPFGRIADPCEPPMAQSTAIRTRHRAVGRCCRTEATRAE